MKLIIDIPEERLDSIKHFGMKQNEVSMLERALIIGTPLDDVKAEINEMPTDYCGGYIGLDKEEVLQILDNIGRK